MTVTYLRKIFPMTWKREKKFNPYWTPWDNTALYMKWGENHFNLYNWYENEFPDWLKLLYVASDNVQVDLSGDVTFIPQVESNCCVFSALLANPVINIWYYDSSIDKTHIVSLNWSKSFHSFSKWVWFISLWFKCSHAPIKWRNINTAKTALNRVNLCYQWNNASKLWAPEVQTGSNSWERNENYPFEPNVRYHLAYWVDYNEEIWKHWYMYINWVKRIITTISTDVYNYPSTFLQDSSTGDSVICIWDIIYEHLNDDYTKPRSDEEIIDYFNRSKTLYWYN